MATINQSQLNKGRLDKFLLVLNLPTAMQDDTKKTLLGRDNKNTIQDSLQFSVYGSIVPKVAVPLTSNNIDLATGRFVLVFL